MSHIETGNTKLSLPVLVAFAMALNVRTDDLLFDVPKDSANSSTTEIMQVLDSSNTQELQIISDLIRAIQVSLRKYL